MFLYQFLLWDVTIQTEITFKSLIFKHLKLAIVSFFSTVLNVI